MKVLKMRLTSKPTVFGGSRPFRFGSSEVGPFPEETERKKHAADKVGLSITTRDQPRFGDSKKLW